MKSDNSSSKRIDPIEKKLLSIESEPKVEVQKPVEERIEEETKENLP